MPQTKNHTTTKKKLIPALRFKEFEGEWSSKNIGSVLSIGSGRDYKHLSSGDIPVYGTGGLMTKVNSFLYDGETVCIGRKGTIDKPMFFEGKLWTVDTLFYTHSFLNSTPKFIYNLFQKIKWKEHNEASGVPSLSKTTIEKIKIFIPSLPEQQKIASFLSAVDSKIQQLTRKKELLEQYKKGVMQQLFSGKLRFKIKNEVGELVEPPEWEEKRLGEVCDVKRGASPRPITNQKWFSDNSKIGWVRISDVTKSNKFLEKTEQYLSEEGVKKSRLVKKGNMIMSICATIGKPIYTSFDVCIHDGFVVFENLSLDKEYLFYYLDFIKLHWYDYGQPGTQVNLNSGIVSNEKVPVPIFQEQQKIASFLSSLDTQIEQVTKQIKFTQEFKKGLLQQMFV